MQNLIPLEIKFKIESGEKIAFLWNSNGSKNNEEIINFSSKSEKIEEKKLQVLFDTIIKALKGKRKIIVTMQKECENWKNQQIYKVANKIKQDLEKQIREIEKLTSTKPSGSK